jgi:L-rhamnose mutarotase
MRRIGQIIGLKSDQIEAYERLHTAVWPEVLAMIHACNIRNGELLFAYCQLTPSLKGGACIRTPPQFSIPGEACRFGFTVRYIRAY